MGTFDDMKRDALGSLLALKDLLLEPEKVLGTPSDGSRDHEVIFSSKECETCGNQPLCRADGLQVRCPACKQLHPPRAR